MTSGNLTTHDAFDLYDDIEAVVRVEADEELDVVSTPKTTVIALLVAAVASAIAYQQAPTTGTSRYGHPVTTTAHAPTVPILYPEDAPSVLPLVQGTGNRVDYWAALEAATMSPAIEG